MRKRVSKHGNAAERNKRKRKEKEKSDTEWCLKTKEVFESVISKTLEEKIARKKNM